MPDPQPEPPAPQVAPLILSPDEFAALKTVAERLGLTSPSPVRPEPDTAAMDAGEGMWREQALAAEAKLVVIRDLVETGWPGMPPDASGHAIPRILAIIGSEEES